MADAVQDHLSHGLHAVAALAACFVIDSLGQAIQIAAGVQGVAHLEGAGAGRGGDVHLTQAVVGRRAELFEAGGQQFSLPVALGRASAGVGVVSSCNRQGAGVQTACGGGQGFFGEAGGGGALNPFSLSPQRRRACCHAAQIGAADRQPHEPAKGRSRRHGLDLGHTVGTRNGARLRGMRQRGSPVKQGEKRSPRGSLASRATLRSLFQPANPALGSMGPGVGGRAYIPLFVTGMWLIRKMWGKG